MVTMLFATVALLAFMDKATNDLLVEQREAEASRLRAEAYSALEVVLAVLEEFRAVGNGLHSPAEGWSDPLAFAEYVPTEGRTVEVQFEDESGKISLPRVNATVLTNLFKTWQIPDADAEALTDALMGWMHKEHIYATPTPPDYEHATIPFETPGRSLRSFAELAAIDKVRELFFSEDGRPNEYWQRFVDSMSLFDFQRSNINGARPDALSAVGYLEPSQQQNLSDYFQGVGSYLSQGPGYFQNVAEAAQIAGATGDFNAFSATISALRINLTVKEGGSQFRVTTVIAPPNGATTVQATATSQRAQPSASTNPNPNQPQNRPNAAQNTNQGGGPGNQQNARNLRYPFTLLEIRENAAMPPPPAPLANSGVL
jgi:hypothetical protein